MKTIIKKYKEQVIEAWNDLKSKETRKKQIPNFLTASRLFSPFVIIPSVATGNFVLAAVSTLLFSFTDMVDGLVARKMHTTSELGRDLDAVTDKIFAGTLLMSLVLINSVYIIPLFLEGMIATVNITKKFKGQQPETRMIGKVKTTSLYSLLALGFMNMYIHIPGFVLGSLYGATMGLQTLTIREYCKEKTLHSQETKGIENDLLQPEIPLQESSTKEKTITELRIEKYKLYKKYLEEQKQLEVLNNIYIEQSPKQKIKK